MEQGTLGALRTNAEYAAYGATRSAARSVVQALAKETSKYGIHAVHAVANGPIRDEDSEETRTGARMSAAAVGAEYLHLMEQSPALWTHEVSCCRTVHVNRAEGLCTRLSNTSSTCARPKRSFRDVLGSIQLCTDSNGRSSLA